MICVDCGKIGLDAPVCDNCNKVRAARFARTTELRAVYREAYFAVLGGMPRVGMESNIGFVGLINEARRYALETVRQWPAMQVELDKLIGEME